MKLIKINKDHYVVVDDSEIQEGDWLLDTTDNTIWGCYKDMSISLFPECKKITHSTQPLEKGTTIHGIEHKRWVYVKYIDLSEVKELIDEVDVEKKADEKYPISMQPNGRTLAGGVYDVDVNFMERHAYKKGYNQAIEDNKEKKYTEEDIRKAYMVGKHGGVTQTYYEFEDYIQSIQPKTEWEVCFVDDKLKLI